MVTTIEVNKDGKVQIPAEVWEAAGVSIPTSVDLIVQEATITLMPHRPLKPLSTEDKANLRRIRDLLEETFAEANWTEIHRGREERCF